MKSASRETKRSPRRRADPEPPRRQGVPGKGGVAGWRQRQAEADAALMRRLDPAKEVIESRATIEEEAPLLDDRALAKARRLNPRYFRRLDFDPVRVSGNPDVGSADFARAVAATQRDLGLTVDGIAGPVTCEACGALPEQSVDRREAVGEASLDPAKEVIESRATLSPGDLERPVQRRAAGSATTADIHTDAARGVAGAGGKLPHAERIQAGFGRHDISGLRAHVGGPAAEAADAIGAEAYATGADLAFRSSPDLDTAAHEAAHAVDQRAGVSLKGGVGEPGDPYERNADAVAAAVVRGESAEGLLDEVVGGRRGATGRAVQRKERGDPGRNPKTRREQPKDWLSGGLSSPIRVAKETLTISATPGQRRTGWLKIWAEDPCRLRLRLSDDEIFSVASPNPAAGIDLEEGQEYLAAVVFAPKARGSVEATLELASSTRAGSEIELETSVLSVAVKGTTDKVAAAPEEKRTPYDVREEKGGSTERKKPKSEPENLTEVEIVDREKVEAIEREKTEAIELTKDWDIGQVSDHLLSNMLASLTNFKAALDIFAEVVSAPSKREAAHAGAVALALENAGTLLVKLVAKPLLGLLPGGGGLYEIFKEGLKVPGRISADRKRAKGASEKNALKDFVTAYIQELAEMRSEIESEREMTRARLEKEYERPAKGTEREAFKKMLFGIAEGIRGNVSSGSLSVTALFTRLAREWLTETSTSAQNPNRLIVMLDADWRLTSGHIRGPAGDRLAEKLLESHNGSLNVPMLGLPVEVRWFPFSGQSGGGTAYGSAWLAADGTLERIRVVGMVANSRALGQKMKEQLVAQGVPEVTKLTGDKSSS